MTPEEIAALATQAVEAALKTKADNDKAAADAQAADQARIDAEVEKRMTAMKAEQVAGRRLPDNRAPHVTAFHDTRKYDGLGVDDLAFTAEVLSAAKRRNPELDGVSDSALKALAIKIAEDKSEHGDEARADLKAAGLNPADVVNATKANELNYSSQSGYGDEWVVTEYSRRLWPALRAGTFVLQKLAAQTVDIPEGVESITIPLEGTDPSWYRVGQATDLNSTTGRPDATIGGSKLATPTPKTLSTGKIGARTVYSIELTEDSMIPWAAQLRQQLEKSGAESIEHLLIDGDTATGATTNINHIGGTPTSTGATQDLFLALDGFRKLALVTNTANSRSAGGALVDTDFLETVKLMGTAGLNGADKTKTEFILDANLYWKILTLVSVKTRDIFQNATLENGDLTRIWGYTINPSFFMHYKSTTNARKANTAGKVDQTTQANNTTGSMLAVRWDQWMLGYKRRTRTAVTLFDDADGAQITTTVRLGMVYRDTEAAAISYNVLV